MKRSKKKRGAPEASPWVEVTPGEQGTPKDEFLSFTYWEPSTELAASLVEDARQTGRLGLPDVTAPNPLDEPDGLTRLRGIVLDACSGRAAAAVDLFAKDQEEIAEIVSLLRSGPPQRTTTPENHARDLDQHRRLSTQLDVLEARMNRLEDALEKRLDRLIGHFSSLAAEFTHELKRHHPHPKLLAVRWDPADLDVPKDVWSFGQDTARTLIAQADRVTGLVPDAPTEGDAS